MESGAQQRRIVVALDPSVHARAALDAASELASRLDAELVGVFVEDVELMRIAALPFSAEHVHYAPAPRAMSPTAMQRALCLQADKLRSAVKAAAERHGVRWQFRAVRGQVAAELLAAGREADMLILGRASSSRLRRVRIGSTARIVATQSTRTVVLLQQGARITRPVVVAYDGTETADRAVTVAARMARTDHGSIVVLVPRAADDRLLRERAAHLLGSAAEHARFVAVPTAGSRGLLRALRAEGGRTLVIGADSLFLEELSLTDLLAELDCPAVVVR